MSSAKPVDGIEVAMAVNLGDGIRAYDTSSRMIHVTARLPGLGAELGLLLAEDPARFDEFMREAERLDDAFKRWEYVRGAGGVPGAAANVVGQLPPDLPYTGFEGYWAGSAQPEEAIIAEEAAMGEEVLARLARLSGTEHAWRAGLDISRDPRAHALLDTAYGHNYALGSLQRLEPLFGEALGRLRATTETSAHPDAYDAFQADVQAAIAAIPTSTYLDPDQHMSLSELSRTGGTVKGRDIEEHYEVPRARVSNQHINTARLRGRAHEGYRIMSEIGRLGHPLVRALLHISDWPMDGRLEFYAPTHRARYANAHPGDEWRVAGS